jgi:hypothetical protein
MLVNRLQRHLENLYEVRSGYQVADFLIDDPCLARRLDRTRNPRDIPEKLLIHQDGDSLNLALYLDRDLLQRLADDDPTESLHGQNLHDFWMALEGISHFIYLTWNAGHQRSVTLLEMELQAEIDKYILAAVLFGRQTQGLVPTTLYARLFNDTSFDQRLDATERRRYHRANYFAGRFCSYLEKEFLQPGARRGLINTLRRFYRLTQQRKITAIQAL